MGRRYQTWLTPAMAGQENVTLDTLTDTFTQTLSDTP